MSVSDYTEYILRFSYGKDSFKTLDVIWTRGLPLDRITTTDVWATDTVPAWLPPMQEFKDRMDEWIWDKYRLQVEHLCARNKDGSKRTYEQMFYHVPVRRSQSIQVERERESGPPAAIQEYRVQGTITGFPPNTRYNWCQKLKLCGGDDQGIPVANGNHLLPKTQNSWDRPSKAFLSPGRGTGSSGVRISRPKQNRVFQRAPHEARKNKYRGVSGHCGG